MKHEGSSVKEHNYETIIALYAILIIIVTAECISGIYICVDSMT